MSLLAECSLPIDDFVLGRALQQGEIHRIEFDCNIPTWTKAMPYFWVWGDTFHEFERMLEGETAIQSVTQIDQLDEIRLYRAVWRSHIPFLLEAATQSHGLLRKLTGDGRWELEVLFEHNAHLATFFDYYTATGMELHLERVYSLSSAPEDSETVTPAQREALRLAVQEGFYNEPREITMEELADKLGISIAAVSGRLRRGTSKLVQNSLV